jgi:hypothetical protein
MQTAGVGPQSTQKKKGTAMRRVIRAFQVEYKNSCKRIRRPVDSPLETVASVFGNSARTGAAEAAGNLHLSEQSVKNCVIRESIP